MTLRWRVRPVLLLLVFSGFLLIVGTTAAGQALFVSADTEQALLESAAGSDTATVRSFIGLNLTPADLAVGGPTAERRANLRLGLSLMRQGGILRGAIIGADGTVLITDDGIGEGSPAPSTTELTRSIGKAEVIPALVTSDVAGATSSLGTTTIPILREYVPIMADGRVFAVAALWRDAGPILAHLDEARTHVVASTVIAGLISVIVLFLIFRAAQQRLSRQARALVEAAGRDALTNSLNHGSLVEALAARIDATRREGDATGVALIDLDNFGLLNDTHGHSAGDFALTEVADILRRELPPDSTWGRYGPDEFLVISAAGGAADLEPAMERLRMLLADLSLQFEASERLPVSVSVGICFHPINGESVTTLLSAAAVTLEDARTSGGDAVRVAEAKTHGPAHAKTFDILQGLVIAVDTKDRYTRRHSEDVARYADFLADRLDLDPEMKRALHTAGLLHDVGKIGIPDTILRKPGPLNDDEFEIVKQHVTLGDMIVRDLPGIEVIRAGVRHHHERWDGNGYVDRLTGEDIPLVARILAVGDAFSAMTTTRPYRKAMPIEDALRRLEDASGTQLDARLVVVFVSAMRTADDAPLPGASRRDRAVPAVLRPHTQQRAKRDVA
jgi:diguanylate cyclase (GGDEF)-like protein